MAERADAQLLQSPDAADFGRFYERHVGAVVAYLGPRVRGPEIVFDLTAETFARALEHRDQYDPARGPAVAWLLGIARHLIIDAARRRQVSARSRLRMGLAPIALDDEQLARIEARSRVDLRTALAALAPTEREAVIARVLCEQPYAELAAHFRCSEQVARKRVSRGLARLRRVLEEHP
jgi:RNA polymerase sigma-70 factor, ECF subfamily